MNKLTDPDGFTRYYMDNIKQMKFTTCLHLDEYIRSTVWYSFSYKKRVPFFN